MKVSAHEDYYYNNVISGSNVRVDRVKVQNGQVMISNGFSTTAASSYANLNENGEAMVDIEVNSINFSQLDSVHQLRTLDMSMTIDNKSVNAPQLKAYLLGFKNLGNDFVTGGPIRLLNILRDPPGSNSYSYVEAGQTMTYKYTTSLGKKHGYRLSTGQTDRCNFYFGESTRQS